MEQRWLQRTRLMPAQYAQVQAESTCEETEEEYDGYDDVKFPLRMPSSARRYQGLAGVRTVEGHVQADARPMVIGSRSAREDSTGVRSALPSRRLATQANLAVVQARQKPAILPERQGWEGRRREQVPPADKARELRAHWLVFVGLGMLTMVVVWGALTILTGWWQGTLDDWHYGRPRTYQVDVAVGHHDSAATPSHFIALNLNRHIEVIEFPGGDPSQARVYIGPTLIGSGQDLAVVTLTFKDVNGDRKADMIINIEDSHFIFINDHGQFRPALPNEHV